MHSCCRELLLDLLDSLVEIILQILLFGVLHLFTALNLILGILRVYVLLKLLDLLLKLCDYFLTVEWSLGKLFLNVLMINKIFLKVGDYVGHFMILQNQVLCLSWLVVQFCSQLSVLHNCKLGSALQLIFFRDWVLHPHLPNLHQHLLSQFISLLDDLLLDVINHSLLCFMLLLYLLSPEVSCILDFLFIDSELFKRSFSLLELC